MATFKGNPVTLIGERVKVGDIAPDFNLLSSSLENVKLNDFLGKIKVISVIPSIDTGVCDFQTRKFNEECSGIENVVVITVSCDLPFAFKKWCGAAGLENIVTLSDHRDVSFGQSYGVLIEELRLLNRAVFILDEKNKVIYAEYLEENANHPNYEAALNTLKRGN